MEEVFSNPDQADLPLKEQTYYVLRLDDFTESWKPNFTVSQTRYRWSEIDRQMMGDDGEHEEWTTIERAKERYETRQKSILQMGYTFSDMDLF